MQMSASQLSPVDILILGAGWTSTFLIPLCTERSISSAATSRPSHPKPDTVPFAFDENDENPSEDQFAALPDAKTVLVTFPITAKGASERLVRMYERTRTSGTGRATARWIQLGTTGVWDKPTQAGVGGSVIWSDRHTAINKDHRRGAAEEELLALSPGTPTTVLNLSGLWGGTRMVKNWVGRVAPTREALKSKGSLHVIHGKDVARAILAVHDDFDKAAGQRWLLTDGRVQDWWDLASAWGVEVATIQPGASTTANSSQGTKQGRGPQPGWVQELMQEQGIRALPRPIEKLGRALDSQEFWNTFGIQPVMGRIG